MIFLMGCLFVEPNITIIVLRSLLSKEKILDMIFSLDSSALSNKVFQQALGYSGKKYHQ